MADHFEEVVNLRLSALEARVNEEASAVEQHFAEMRTFITKSLHTLAGQLRSEMSDMGSGLRGELYRLEQKMDAHHEATHLILRDILRRLPGASA